MIYEILQNQISTEQVKPWNLKVRARAGTRGRHCLQQLAAKTKQTGAGLKGGLLIN